MTAGILLKQFPTVIFSKVSARIIRSPQNIIYRHTVIVRKVYQHIISRFSGTAFISADAILVQIQVEGNFKLSISAFLPQFT